MLTKLLAQPCRLACHHQVLVPYPCGIVLQRLAIDHPAAQGNAIAIAQHHTIGIGHCPIGEELTVDLRPHFALRHRTADLRQRTHFGRGISAPPQAMAQASWHLTAKLQLIVECIQLVGSILGFISGELGIERSLLQLVIVQEACVPGSVAPRRSLLATQVGVAVIFIVAPPHRR